jgi:S-DNA-T family DNA segregation ATPase FtsK/SpoIIIE
LGITLFRRPARKRPPVGPRGEIVLESPPELPESVSSGNAGQMLQYLPMAGGVGSMVMMGAGAGAKPTTYIASGMMGLSMAGMMAGNVGKQSGEKRRRLDGDRRDYQRYLGQVRKKARSAAAAQRAATLWQHPDPDALWCVVLGTRLWERRPTDGDFGIVRLGRGPQQLAVQLVTPQTKPVEDLEPISSGALRRFVRTHSTVPDLPVAASLANSGRISFRGPFDEVRGLIRAMVAQTITFHSPDDVVVAVCCGSSTAAQWEWLKWVPHAMSPDQFDAVGQVRLISDNLVDLERLLGDTLSQRPRWTGNTEIEGPRILVILDGGAVPADAQISNGLIHGVTVLDLHGALPIEPGAGTLNLVIEGEDLVLTTADQRGRATTRLLGSPDQFSLVQAESLARQMAALRMSAASEADNDALSVSLTLPELLRIGDPYQINTATTWRPRAPRDRLRVPIGVGPDGQPVDLDIKEAAQAGMGPHGLLIGATGSGKSEVLRTLVMGLAVTHSSEQLNFVLVDFKGGATFASLDVLPHTSAVITNLSDNLILVDRMKDSLNGEMERRQELLRDAGNYASLKDYERDREQGAPLEPMPSLFVVVDEFSELLTAKPDFIDLFIKIGRVGRSLGVHLLLASQRLEEGKLRGLDTYLSYRLALRTFNAMESRVVIGVPDAYELPSGPGNGYLKVDTTGLIRFKAAYVSGPYTRVTAGSGSRGHVSENRLLAYSTQYQAPKELPVEVEHEVEEVKGPVETMMDVMVGRLTGQGRPARQVWLPPLDAPPSLDQLMPALAETAHGLRPAGWDEVPPLTVAVGLVDKPFEQRRDPMYIELASGHAVIAGGPQSGKSTLLRSLIASFAVTHTPQQVQFYCIDLGGGTLTGLADLPHVGSVATRLEPDRLRRTTAEVNALLESRERVFTEHRIDSMASYRRAVANGSLPSDGFGDVFVVIDGWGTLRQEHEALEQQIMAMASRGLGFGVHVIITVQRWMEVRPGLKDLINTRIELRLGDPSESEIDRKAAQNVPDRTPGRGMTPDKLHFLAALPRIDDSSDSDSIIDGIEDLVARVSAAWRGPGAPAVRMLPDKLPYADLPLPDPNRNAVPIGIDEETLAPVLVDFDTEPHMLIIGDVESGKSNLLRTIAAGITQRYTPQQAKIITFDYRRGLLGAITTPHQIAYVMNSTNAPQTGADIAAALKERLAGIQIDQNATEVPEWTGPKLFVIIDDYDILTGGGGGNPLLPLAEFLPQARDIGLHVILARAAGGVGRGMFDPMMQRIREMGSPGVLLSGSKDEGAVLGAVKLEPLPQGRGRYVHRRTGAVLIQTARIR